MTKPIGQLIFDYNEAKEDLKGASEDLIKKAMELGLNEKTAQDARISLAYLTGYLKGKK